MSVLYMFGIIVPFMEEIRYFMSILLWSTTKDIEAYVLYAETLLEGTTIEE